MPLHASISFIICCIPSTSFNNKGQLKDTDTQNKYMKDFACACRPSQGGSKQAHTWYQRARLQGECVWLPCQGESVCGGRSCECVCSGARWVWWGSAGSAATGPRGRPSRGTAGQSCSSAVRSSPGPHSQ